MIDAPEGRKNHTATIVGNHMLIHGGINSSGQFLKDL